MSETITSSMADNGMTIEPEVADDMAEYIVEKHGGKTTLTEEEFNDFYENIKKLSIYDTGVTAEFGDHFITLSTCVSHVPTGRFVVVAKEITDTTQK